MCHGQLIEHAIRKARKAHRCSCGVTIQPGDLYERQLTRDGGALGTWVGCRDCAIRNAAFWVLEDGDMDSCHLDRDEVLREHAMGGGWRRVLGAFRKARARFVRGPR